MTKKISKLAVVHLLLFTALNAIFSQSESSNIENLIEQYKKEELKLEFENVLSKLKSDKKY